MMPPRESPASLAADTQNPRAIESWPETARLDSAPARTSSSNPDRLAAALDPKAIAVIGASDNPNKVGGRPIAYLSRFGYRGRIFPINPARATVQGLEAYASVADLPEVPALAIIAAPASAVASAVDACAERGVRLAIIMSSGFGETSDPIAIAAERDLVARARAAGMRIVGPNSQGLANFATGVVASFSTMFHEVPPSDGPVGIVSQSGIMSVVPYGLLRARGIGVRHVHATGNDADVSLPELALVVARDPAVRLLLLYIEGIRDAEALALAAETARERDVPVVAVKSGRTAGGQSAARSHTNALASEDRIVDAFFRKHAIWRARDMHELVSTAELYLKGWRPGGRKLVAISNSGATCVMAADAVQDCKLELAVLRSDTATALAGALPAFATTTNPVDVTAALLTDSHLFGKILPILAEDDGIDLSLIGLPVAGAGYDVERFAQDAAAFGARTHKPLVVVATQPLVAAPFRNVGLPTFENPTDAIESLAQLVHHTGLMRRGPARRIAPLKVSLPPGTDRFLSEAESLKFLGAFGLPCVRLRLCGSAAEARQAFREFGGPVVVKACSARFPHKSDLGLVVLNVQTEADVGIAFNRLWTGLQKPLAAGDGIIVAPMLSGRRELALGGKFDPIFGPTVMIGDGGRYVEVVNDIALLIPPFDIDDARAALLDLRVAAILRGTRGEAPLDLGPLCQAAVTLGRILSSGTGQIASIDMNPVIVGSADAAVTIVDALVERAAGCRDRDVAAQAEC